MLRTDCFFLPGSTIRSIASAAALCLVLSTSAWAQEDVDLKPADFVPEEPVAIRVDAMKPGQGGSDVSVTILNRTKASVGAVVECTLYDADREDLGVATGRAVEVGAGERKAATVAGAEAAKYAECRVKSAK